MKKYIVITILTLALFLCGCGEKAATGNCVKCGKETNSTIMGPIDILERSYHVDISDCKQINSGVYCVYICDSCNNVPVASISPD